MKVVEQQACAAHLHRLVLKVHALPVTGSEATRLSPGGNEPRVAS